MSDAARRPALPRRLMAMVYDTFLVLPLVMLGVVLGMAVHAGVVMLGGAEDADILGPWPVRLIAVTLICSFFTAFWMKSGQTLGMQAWRVRLVPMAGTSLTVPRCLLRCAGALISIACLGLGYLWCLVDRHGRCWHDYLSGTELELLPKSPRRGQQPAA